jgi:hypothetical protein
VETNRRVVQGRIEAVVRWAIATTDIREDLDVELTARAIRSLSEEAGRQVLTDPENYSPERYARFVLAIMKLIWVR